MKIYIKDADDYDNIFAMSKLMSDLADKSITGNIPKFVYFSESKGGHSPRIKFYGGTKETGRTDTAPTMAFGNNDEYELILQPWMNKKSCPNGYDKAVIDDVEKFISKNRPILLLVWFGWIDEGYALEYFYGRMPLRKLLSTSDVDIPGFVDCENMNQLDKFCKANNLYEF